jgi:hypothetical protein
MKANKNTKNDQDGNAYSTDGKHNTHFPGYPHYPENEDITRHGNNEGEESLDEENISLSGADDEDVRNSGRLDYNRDEDEDIVSGTDADVTKEDLRMLEAADQNMDTVDDINLETGSLDSVDEDGDPLNEEDSINEDMSGKDLDVPGSEDDDADENIGEEDEENNYYSLGGDDHESQEEDNYDS